MAMELVQELRAALLDCCMDAASVTERVNAALDPDLCAQKVCEPWLDLAVILRLKLSIYR